MRSIRSRQWFGSGPLGASPGRKKRFIVGRPLRSGWRPTAMRHGVFAIAPVLLIAGSFVAIGHSPLAGFTNTADPQPIARGDGHGRGLGQYGSLDYAKQGWKAEQILVHYYPGATLAPLPPTKITVRLLGRDDKSLDVYSDAGVNVAGRQATAGEAVHLTPTPGGAKVTITAGCTGGVVWEGETDNPWVDPIDPGPARPAGEHLKLCEGDKSYRGSLGVALEGAATRTVNYVDMEDYLLGVVPLEMPPNWADSGGAEAVRAQAIAARSYAATEKRSEFAQTCDNTNCQMYGGSSIEDPRSTTAVQSTAGTVLMNNGSVVHAEYSASSDQDGQAEDKLALAPPPAPAAPPAEPAAPGAPPVDPTMVVAPAGPIEEKYRELGGLNSDLGAPIGPEMMLPQAAGKFRMFANGVIVWTPELGAQEMSTSFLTDVLPAVEGE